MTPEGWQVAKVEDFAETFSGGTPSRERADYYGGPIRWVKSGEVNAGRVRTTEETISVLGLQNSSAKLVPAGSVLVAMYGATAGKVALLEIEAAINQAILAILGRVDRASNEYLVHALNLQGPELLRRVQGSGQPNLSGSLIRSLEVPLPPLPEQRKIAAILTSVDEAIEGTQAVIGQLQVVKKAMMAELLTKGIPGRHTKFKMTEIGEVPEEWDVTSIDVLGIDGEPTVRTGPFGSSMKTKDFTNSGIPVLTIQSLGQGEILEDGLFYTGEAKAHELAAYKVQANDVVFSRVADIGRCAAITDHEAGWLISPNLSRIRLDPVKADAQFLMYLITTGPSVLRQVEMVSGSGGRPVISSSTLKEMLLPLPPYDEQKAIARAGLDVEVRLRSERDFQSQLQATKSALMSVLLTGEVRVQLDEDAA